MKRLIIALTALIFLSSAPVKAQTDNRLFPYPEPPKDMTNLYERCNFLVYKFWDQCNIKSAFSTKAKLNIAFRDWLSFMPYASADTVYMSIDRFHNSLKKSGEHALEIAKMAEGWLYSDTASFHSEELYSRFVDAAVANKKIPAAERRHFEEQKLILDNSSVGKTVPDIPLTTADGSATSFSADSSAYTLLFVYRPDCLDCSFARVRLSADMVLNQLNDGGVIRVVTLYAGEPDAAFAEAVAQFPKNWINLASPETSRYFDMRKEPAIYYLDSEHKIVAKELEVDNILNMTRQLIK